MAWALLALAACREPVPADYSQYTGHWRGDGVRLVLLPNGQASYERISEGSRTRIEGPVHGFDKEGFRIGVGLFSARFKVQQPPHLFEGQWRMTVDGHDLVRVEILPGRPDRDSYAL